MKGLWKRVPMTPKQFGYARGMKGSLIRVVCSVTIKRRFLDLDESRLWEWHQTPTGMGNEYLRPGYLCEVIEGVPPVEGMRYAPVLGDEDSKRYDSMSVNYVQRVGSKEENRWELAWSEVREA